MTRDELITAINLVLMAKKQSSDANAVKLNAYRDLKDLIGITNQDHEDILNIAKITLAEMVIDNKS